MVNDIEYKKTNNINTAPANYYLPITAHLDLVLLKISASLTTRNKSIYSSTVRCHRMSRSCLYMFTMVRSD